MYTALILHCPYKIFLHCPFTQILHCPYKISRTVFSKFPYKQHHIPYILPHTSDCAKLLLIVHSDSVVFTEWERKRSRRPIQRTPGPETTTDLEADCCAPSEGARHGTPPRERPQNRLSRYASKRSQTEKNTISAQCRYCCHRRGAQRRLQCKSRFQLA